MATDIAALAAVEAPVAVAEPSATPTPTPEVTPSAEPVAPVSDQDFIGKAVAKAIPLDAEGNISKPEAAKPAEVAAEKSADEIEAERIAAAATETPEQKAEREKVETEKAKVAETSAEVDPLDKVGALPAEKWAEALKTNPELEAALTKAGIDKDVLFETSRAAARCSQFEEIYPTLDAAKFAQESAGNFYKIEESFPSIQTLEDLDSFITNTMLPLSIVPGADGKPQLAADGKSYVTDGSVSRFLKLGTDYDMGMSTHLAEQMLAAAEKLPEGEQRTAQSEYAQNLKAAIDYVQDFRNNGYRQPTAKAAAQELSPELKARVENAERIERESKERESATAKEKEELFDNQVLDVTVKGVDPLIAEALNKSSLPDTLKEKVAKEIYDKINTKLLADAQFKRLSDSYRAKGLTEETKQTLAAHNTRTIKGLYGKIVEEVLAEYGARQIADSTARQKKIDTQVAADKIHPGSTSSAPAKGPSPLTAEQINKQAYENAKAANGGKEPDLNDVFNERLKLSGRAISA